MRLWYTTSMIKNLTMQNFHEETDNGVCLIDFWAAWCGPCKMLSPIIDEIGEERSDIKVCKVNVDEEDRLASAFGVVSIPTVVLMRDGKVEASSIGYVPKNELLDRLGL